MLPPRRRSIRDISREYLKSEHPLIVAVELAAISWIRYRYMDTPFLSAAFQVVIGGVLVFLAGILIGNS